MIPLASESLFSLYSTLAFCTRFVQFRLPFPNTSLTSSFCLLLALRFMVLRFFLAVLSSAVHQYFDFLCSLLSGVSRSISLSMYSRTNSADWLVWFWLSQASGGKWNWETKFSSCAHCVFYDSLLRMFSDLVMHKCMIFFPWSDSVPSLYMFHRIS